MKQRFYWDLNQVRAQGIAISIGKRLTSGRLLILARPEEILFGLSDLVNLNNYSEVQINYRGGENAVYITTASLLRKPQIFLGYEDSTGAPILLGVTELLKTHLAFIGMSQSYKSTSLAQLALALIRMGYGFYLISMKCLDAVLIAAMKYGCDSPTRCNAKGQIVKAPMAILTMEFGQKTSGLNPIEEMRKSGATVPEIKAAVLRIASPGGAANDPNRKFFTTSESAFIQKLPDVGTSFGELSKIMKETKQTREEQYSTSGLQNEIAQLAGVKQVNLPESHPSNIDLKYFLKNKGSVYFDASFQDAGNTGTAAASAFTLALIKLKRKYQPGRNSVIYVAIDECQQFNQDLLKQIIEQCSGLGIRLILAYHNLEQLGENVETIGMTQVKFLFNADPGSKTDRYLQSLFGTKKHYLFNMGFSEGASSSESISLSSSATGDSITHSLGVGSSVQANYGFSETEVPRWSGNDTHELNYDRNKFVVAITVGAECAFYGPRPIVCERPAFPLSWDRVNELAEEALNSNPNAFVPGEPEPRQLPNPELTPVLAEKRARWSSVLRTAALDIRKQYS